MTPISRASVRSVRRQRGVVLFVALIAMVILSMAGVALVRTVDSSMGVAGNLAFRNISMAPVNHGIEESIKMIFKTKPSPAAPFSAHVPGRTTLHGCRPANPRMASRRSSPATISR